MASSIISVSLAIKKEDTELSSALLDYICHNFYSLKYINITAKAKPWYLQKQKSV